MIIWIICLFLPCFALEAAKEETDEIVIRLSTESQLIPVYLAKVAENGSGLNSNYLKQLEEILHFDFNHSGMTYTVTQNNEREKLANQLAESGSVKGKQWQALSAFYVIKISINSNKSLLAQLLAVNGDAAKQVDGITLTGNLAKDRTSLHQLSDAIHKALFGKEGIASTRILYTVRRAGGFVSDIWEADYDGENAHCIVQDKSYNITPVYIPPKAGNRSGSFFYVSYKTGQPKIYIASLRSTPANRLTLIQGNQLMPSISSSRDAVAFICDVTGNPDLFLQPFTPEQGLTGKPRQIFSSKKATQGSPSFSPDSRSIAFVSNKDGSPRIYVIDIPAIGKPLKDINAQLISKHSREASAPAWSPDGTKLAYCALVDGTRQIWVYDFNTQEERQLTQGPLNKENPTWAPNSLTLMYNSSNPNDCELYLININQPKATKISSGLGEKRFPNWEPRA